MRRMRWAAVIACVVVVGASSAAGSDAAPAAPTKLTIWVGWSARELGVFKQVVAEYDKNSPEYVPVEELKATNDPRWIAMLDGIWEQDGEDEETFNARTIGAIERIIGEHRGERVAIVCHGGVINAYLTHILDLEVGSRGFFYPNYTSIHRVAAASSGERSVVTINETSHLRGTGLPMGLFQNG